MRRLVPLLRPLLEELDCWLSSIVPYPSTLTLNTCTACLLCDGQLPWLLRYALLAFPAHHGREVQRRLERGLANKHVQSVADLRQQLLPNAP